MSRFNEFANYLNEKQFGQKRVLDFEFSKANNSRIEHQKIIYAAFSIFEDFYKTVLEPRVKPEILLRKKDKPTDYDLINPNNTKPFYAYVVNLIPPVDKRPGGYENAGYLPGWVKPEITDNDNWGQWYPMSSMQFAVLLSPKYLHEEKTFSDKLELSVHMRAWGIIDIPKEKKLLSPNMYIRCGDGGWAKNSTDITINHNKLGNFEESIIQSLILLAPNVIEHKKIVES